MKKTATACAAVLAVALGACGGDSFSRDDAIGDLQEMAGLTEDQAVCVVDALEDAGVDLDELTKDEPSDDVITEVSSATTGCVLVDMGAEVEE